MFQGMMGGINPNDMMGGGHHEAKLDGYSDDIKSQDIIFFEYSCNEYVIRAEKKDDKVVIICNGHYSNHRDGRYFRIKYESEDLSIFDELQKVVVEGNISNGNGTTSHTDGLPAGIGDIITINYASGEKIYKYANNYRTVSPEYASKFYNVFRNYVQKYGLDFTSKGSNQKLYDDPDEEYLQGAWTGKHFGNELLATFDKDKVKITVDGKEVENATYKIVEGRVVKDKLSEENADPDRYTSYENFEGISLFGKKNYFTLSCYFLTESYSTCDLHNFDKKKPEDEE